MSLATPHKEWWSPADLADSRLPDVPTSKRGVEQLAKREGWRMIDGAVRRRSGRGGGFEYSWQVLPVRARKKLVLDACDAEVVEQPDRRVAWAEYEGLTLSAKRKAEARLAILEEVEALVHAGYGRGVAVGEVAGLRGKGQRTIWGWFQLVEGVRRDDWLPALAPRHQTAKRTVEKAECSPEAWEALKADYLRVEQPALEACYRRLAKLASKHCWVIPTPRTLLRRIQAEIPEATLILAREGSEALARRFPPMVRDKSGLHALEAVNADFHKFDVWVNWPGYDKPIRPQMCVFQDVYSGRVLSWRMADHPNKETTALCLGDMVERFGIPDHCLFDNGREFANKFLTGGAETRFRFKIMPNDPLGILNLMGIKQHWATPGHGQAKPVERAFRDMCEDISKHPRFAGAWTGNRPDAKPENYMSKAIPFEEFMEVVGIGIAEHNARPGRRSKVCNGRSFVETFEASYANAPIRRATEAQRRLWLMGAQAIRAHRDTAMVKFQGNEFWSPWMSEIAGQQLVARFDPADLHAGLHLYHADGRYLGLAALKEAGGFFDIDDARAHARAKTQFMRAERDSLKAARTMSQIELARLHKTTSAPPDPTPAAPRVIRGKFGASAAAVAIPAPDPDEDALSATEVAEMFERGVLSLVKNDDD